jgi:hypothetical protein
MKYLLLSIFALFVLAGCKKEPLPVLPEENEPYYSVRGLVNTDSINWVVGMNEVEISHGVTEMNGVKSFFGQISSPQDGMALKIEILSPERVYTGTEIAAVTGGELDYLVHRTGSVKFNFGMNYEQFNYLLVKDELNNYVVMDQVPFAQFGIYDVHLKFTDYGSESFVVPVKFGFENQELHPGFASSGNGGNLHVTPFTVDGAHQWYMNGTLVSQEASLLVPIQNGIHTICHKIQDEFGNTAEHTTLIRIKDNTFYWQLKYYYVPPVQASSHYGNVVVSMLKDGVWYTSSNADVNLSSLFTVSDVSTILNADLEPEWTLFDFAFGATLYNDNQTNSLYLPHMEGAVSVGLTE